MERPYRPLTEESRSKRLVRTVAYWGFYPILWISFIPLFGLRTSGRERLKGPAISVMNHCVYIEWFFIWHAARPRYIRFTAEEANMSRKDVGWFNRILGVIGIPEDHPMTIAPSVSRALERGELVHFFPEGVLKPRNQKPGGFMTGAAWFACRRDVPLIPITEILHGRKIQRFLPWWPPRVRLMVGEPLLPRDYRKPGDRLRDTAARMTFEAERTIRETIVRESGGYRMQSKS